MKKHNKRKFGVATKTSVISGIIVLILLCLSSIISIKMQSSSSRIMIDSFIDSQSDDLEDYTKVQTLSIRENTKINSEIISSISEAFIYNFDQDNLKKLLAGFVRIDGIIAIKVLDMDHQPFAAAWKDKEILTAYGIPEGMNLREEDSFSKEAIHDGETVGTVQVFFTDQKVKNEIAVKKVKTEKRITEFRGIAANSINASFKIQLIVSISIIVALIVSIVLCLQLIVTKPIHIITRGMNEGANQVASSSNQVSNSSQSLAETSSDQAASIEETTSSMEEMASMTQRNAENASHADTLMEEANQVIKTANKSMDQLTLSMDEISKASEETSKIIKTIDEIAFKTNLLALNAAVEAARAGEAGAGFAVVADEVRNLAMNAADAAQNTTQLIEGTVKKINLGTTLVSTTNDAFKKVEMSTGKVGDLVTEISEASKEQSEGIEQVKNAIVRMDNIVQKNAANAEETASVSEEMNAQAEQLKKFNTELLLLIQGSKGKQINAQSDHEYRPETQESNRDHEIKIKRAVDQSSEIKPNHNLPFNKHEESSKEF